MQRKEVISLDINCIGYDSALSKILELGRANVPSYSCFANVHMVVESYKDPELKRIVNNSTFSFSDGVPLVFALKLFYGIKQERIAGIDFMIDMIRLCEMEGLSVFLFGSTEDVLNSLKSNLLKQYPRLVIAGCISPPFRELSEKEDIAFIDSINNSGANIVFVSLGCPKQEVWMSRNSDKVEATLLGVGAAFEIHAKLIKRAPKWMQRMGLEWLFRFIQEPRRLWKRYVQTNTLFIYLILKKLIVK